MLLVIGQVRIETRPQTIEPASPSHRLSCLNAEHNLPFTKREGAQTEVKQERNRIQKGEAERHQKKFTISYRSVSFSGY